MSLAAGRRWENAAGAYLEDNGLQIVARGYRCRLGEIDLVCRDGAALVIVEVRARATTEFGTAVETVTHGKRRRIVQATRHLLMRRPEWLELPIRFDVVAFDAIDTHEPRISWIKSAFDAA
jgi:putative endonuclease